MEKEIKTAFRIWGTACLGGLCVFFLGLLMMVLVFEIGWWIILPLILITTFVTTYCLVKIFNSHFD